MEVEITRMSSKGQIVLPQNIREMLGLTEGEPLSVSLKDNLIVLKKIENNLDKQDLETFVEIKEAWKEIQKGKCKKMSDSEFLKEISKW